MDGPVDETDALRDNFMGFLQEYYFTGERKGSPDLHVTVLKGSEGDHFPLYAAEQIQ